MDNITTTSIHTPDKYLGKGHIIMHSFFMIVVEFVFVGKTPLSPVCSILPLSLSVRPSFYLSMYISLFSSAPCCLLAPHYHLHLLTLSLPTPFSCALSCFPVLPSSSSLSLSNHTALVFYGCTPSSLCSISWSLASSWSITHCSWANTNRTVYVHMVKGW